jgi:UDP-glucose 4-epimerase
MKCLVLGGDGFIGSHLVDDLLDKGHEIRVFSRFHDGKSFNLEHLRSEIEFFPGNFLNLADLEEALKGIDYVFHMISTSTPASTMGDPLLDIDTNIRGTVNLLELCVESKIKKIIFPSSGGTIYGETEQENISEDTNTNPICPYGISKLAIEKYLDYFHKLHGLDYLIFRISNPYGERQNMTGNQGVIPIFLNLIRQNKPITIFGDGNSIRDYIYVKDVTGFMADASFMDTKHKMYNLGSGVGQSLNELVDVMKDICERNIKIEFKDARKNDIKKFVLDISRIKNEFEFTPKTNVKKGIKKTWKYVNSDDK